MFNIRGILNRRNDQNRSPESLLSRTSDEGVENNASSAEGFLCPHCFLAFPTADALQNHYESSHSEGINDVSDDRNMFNCPACKMKLGSEIELQSHFTRHHSDKEDVELKAMALQVKALEEGKLLLQNELQVILQENTKIREERDSLEQKAAKLSTDLADLKLELDMTKSQKVHLEAALKVSEEKLRKLEVEVQQKPEEDDVIELKKGIKSVQEKMNELALMKEAEKDTLQKQYNSLQDTYSKLQIEKVELENFIRNCPKKEELESLQSKISEMSVRISDLKENLNAKEIEKKQLEITLDKYKNYEEIKASLAEKQQFIQELKRESSEKETLISKLKEELAKIKETVEESRLERKRLFSEIEKGEGASAAMLQLQDENTRLQQQFLAQQTEHLRANEEAESKLNELRTSLRKAETELLASNEKSNELEQELNLVKKKLKDIQSEKDALSKELNLQLANLSAAHGSDKARLENLEGELSKLNKLYEESKSSVENLKLEKSSLSEIINKLQSEKKSQEKHICDLAENLSHVQNEVVQKEQYLTEVEKSKKELGDVLQKEQADKSKLEKENAELQLSQKMNADKIKELESLLEANEATKDEFCKKISCLNEELLNKELKESELIVTVKNLTEENSKMKEKCESLEDEIKNLRTSITSFQNEKNSLLNEMEKLKNAVAELKDLNATQDKTIAELTDLNQKEKANSEKVLKDFNLAKDVYLNDKVKMQKQIENLEIDCAKQLSEMQNKLQSLENNLEEAEEKNSSLMSSLEDTKQLLKQKEREWDETKAGHIAQVGILTENIQTLREDLAAEQKRRECIEQDLDETKGTKLELEAKLKIALEEREVLLKRCIKSEADCEKLQKSVSEMRHKYDDCVAALQELGRENQTLQVENLKHITRKWADDSEVTHCTACGRLFTVTVRKHHCRNCGSIFCNECSLKTAFVASSKKPVRVCDVCYIEVTK